MKHIHTAFFIALFFLGTMVYAQVPRKISYQGLLTTSGGPTVADGSYDLKFDIYNLPSGGVLRYSETHTGVSVHQGTFSILLGTISPLTLTFNESLYVQVTATNGPSGPTYPLTFSPRSELTSSPYALAPWTINGNNVSYPSGNVGIGTTNPTSRLEISGQDGLAITGYQPFLTLRDTNAGNARGIISSGNGDLGFYTNSFIGGYPPVVIKTGTGNVGLGSANPNERLTIAGSMEVGTNNADYQHLRIGGGNSSGYLYGSYGKYGDGIHLGYNYYADAAGNPVVVNPGGATSRLTLGYGWIGLYGGGVNSEPSNLALYVSQYGNVGIGTTSPGYPLSVYENYTCARFESVYGSPAVYVTTDNGDVALEGVSDGSGGYQHIGVYGEAASLGGYYNDGVYGYAYGGTNNWGGYFSGNLGYSGSLVGPSDAKFKENIESYTGALTQLMDVKARTFNFKTGPEYDRLGFSPGKHYGFVAQELEKVFPELVVDAVHPPEFDSKGKPKGDPVQYKGVKTLEMIPILVQAIQEQQKLIEDLQSQVNELKHK